MFDYIKYLQPIELLSLEIKLSLNERFTLGPHSVHFNSCPNLPHIAYENVLPAPVGRSREKLNFVYVDNVVLDSVIRCCCDSLST